MVPLGANERVCSPGPSKHTRRGGWGFACCSHSRVAVANVQGHLVSRKSSNHGVLSELGVEEVKAVKRWKAEVNLICH